MCELVIVVVICGGFTIGIVVRLMATIHEATMLRATL